MIGRFEEIALALEMQANDLADRAQDAETTAARIGLTPVVAARIVADRRHQADLIAEAHRIFRTLAPIEHTVRAVMSAGQGWQK